MMNRDVLLEMEQEEEDDEDGDIGEQGVPRSAPARGTRVRTRKPAPTREEAGECAWALHPPPPAGKVCFPGTLGSSEERGRAPGAGEGSPRRRPGAAMRPPRAEDPGRLRAPLAAAGVGGAGHAGPGQQFLVWGRDAAPEQSRETRGRLCLRKSGLRNNTFWVISSASN